MICHFFVLGAIEKASENLYPLQKLVPTLTRRRPRLAPSDNSTRLEKRLIIQHSFFWKGAGGRERARRWESPAGRHLASFGKPARGWQKEEHILLFPCISPFPVPRAPSSRALSGFFPERFSWPPSRTSILILPSGIKREISGVPSYFGNDAFLLPARHANQLG